MILVRLIVVSDKLSQSLLPPSRAIFLLFLLTVFLLQFLPSLAFLLPFLLISGSYSLFINNILLLLSLFQLFLMFGTLL